MRNYLKVIGLGGLVALALTIFWLFLLPLMVAGKLVNREAQKFDAETSAQTYDNSRQYQQGINRDIARYCREWRAAEGAAAEAVLNLTQTTVDTYEGSLTAANQDCLNEMGVQ